MTATIKPKLESTFHRDGTVSFWSVYLQQWVRQAADQITDSDLASMSSYDRERVQGIS